MYSGKNYHGNVVVIDRISNETESSKFPRPSWRHWDTPRDVTRILWGLILPCRTRSVLCRNDRASAIYTVSREQYNTVHQKGSYQHYTPLQICTKYWPIFARDSIYAKRALCYRNFVCSSVCLSHGWISRWFAVDFFARGLHTRTAVARLPLRQLARLSCKNSFSGKFSGKAIIYIPSYHKTSLHYLMKYYCQKSSVRCMLGHVERWMWLSSGVLAAHLPLSHSLQWVRYYFRDCGR